MTEKVQIKVPDIGDFDEVDVVEILVAVGDTVAVDDSLITLESDKASMEVPSTHAGTVSAIHVALGDQVGEAALIAEIEVAVREAPSEAAPDEAPASEEPPPAQPEPAAPAPASAPPASAPEVSAPRPSPTGALSDSGQRASVHASPSVRRFARELGADLARVPGSGPKGRILKEDVQKWVKEQLSGTGAGAPASGGAGIPPIPAIDFTKFGEVEEAKLHRIRQVSATNLHRSWLNVVHVTQFDEADVTEVEAFRKSEGAALKEQGIRLTPLVFLMRAAVRALQEFPEVNSSLHPEGKSLYLKRYFHLGIAVDTPNGLVVPVIRDVDRKSLTELAVELGEVSVRARDGKLRPADLQGASFTISSLGGIGGTGFTPIVNAPEVAILGVARSKWQPVLQDGEFVPRLMLPFSLSYDHRVIDGAQAVRFTTFLARTLEDVRRLLL